MTSTQLARELESFVQKNEWGSEEPENNADWQRGYECAQSNLREALKPWWPLGGPLTLSSDPVQNDSRPEPAAPVPDDDGDILFGDCPIHNMPFYDEFEGCGHCDMDAADKASGMYDD
jgi:hypothetical protein